VIRFAPFLLLLTAAAPSPYLGANYGTTIPSRAPSAPAPTTPNAYQPAPMPNRDVSAPATVASNEPTVSPTLFSPQQQFRGDGFSGNSTEQAVHDRSLHPAAGLNLSMPLNSW
jgi:hypothetical protein